MQATRRLGAKWTKSRLHNNFILSAGRHFHSTPIPRRSLVDVCCYQTFDLISTLHSSTGLSWVYILPITALAVRGIFVVPLTIWSRVQMKKMIMIQPLLLAWMPRIAQQVRNANPGVPPAATSKLIKLEHIKKSKEIRRDFGINVWTAYTPLLQLPVFMVTMNTIRHMSTGKGGFLGALSTWIEGERYESSIPIQESMITEGSLWFPNLLAPDPTYTLPVVLSSMLYLSVRRSAKAQEALSSGRRSAINKTITTVLKTASIGLLFVTYQLPAAMLVYWVSSSTLAMATSTTLDKLMPIPKAMVPCRPLHKSFIKQPSEIEAKSQSFLSRWSSQNL